MKHRYLFSALCATFLILVSMSSHAALMSRLGGDAYYDTILDITWLADANYAQTSGFDDDGFMNWEEANAWAAGLNISGVTGWRLPTLSPINGVSFNTNFSNNATTDGNYADTEGWVGPAGDPVSELGHLFYVTLGNIGWCTPNDADPSSCVEQTGWDIINIGPFSNLNTFEANGLYWTDTEQDAFAAWVFGFYGGSQIGYSSTETAKAWAVYDGDVSAVPVPTAVWLFSSGLLGLVGMARRKKAT